MAGFFIRVVLHDASWSQYASLGERLANVDVVDYIRGDNGYWYKLPDGEYIFDGVGTVEQARELVALIAGAVVPRFAVFVTQRGDSAWQGLELWSGQSANAGLFRSA